MTTCHNRGCTRTSELGKHRPFPEGWRPVCVPCYAEWMSNTPRATGTRHVTDLLSERKVLIE